MFLKNVISVPLSQIIFSFENSSTYNFFSYPCFFIVDTLSVKEKITDTEFPYEFYTVVRAPKAKPGRYYWFKVGAIHTTQSGTAGEVLDGGFETFFIQPAGR